MGEDIKKTKGVSRMREVFEQVVVAIGEGTLQTDRFCRASCSTCIHKDKPVTSHPCNACTTATESQGRDYRPTDQSFWIPNKDAQPQDIRYHHDVYGLPSLQQLMDTPPVRCINPACSDEFTTVHRRGLCNTCYSKLEKLVVLDSDVAAEWCMMFWLCSAEPEREVVIKYYLELATWDRFVLEGKCLPDLEEDYPDRELILYYRQTRANISRRPEQNPTPTIKQLSKIMTKDQLETARKYLEVIPK